MRLRDIIFRLVLSLAAAGGAEASPWPREAGGHFATVSVERDRDGNSHTGLYGEYGLTPRHTLGYEIGHTNVGETSLMMWLQRALDDGQGPHRWAVSLGLGAVERDGRVMPMGQIGTGWGRGFQRFGGGWMTAEMRVKLAGSAETIGFDTGLDGSQTLYLTPKLTAKGELTLGLRPTPAMMVINQLRLEKLQDVDISAKLALSLVHDLAGPAKVELGLVEPLAGPGERALKIGLWLEF